MRVLHFYHRGYFAPISSGADVIASNQLEYFRDRGWTVDCLLVAIPDRAHQVRAFRERYHWVDSVRLVDPPPGESLPSIRDQLLSYHRIARTGGFRRQVRAGVDLFFTNHVSTAPLLEALPRCCKRLLEALDNMTNSFDPDERIRCPERDPMAPARDSFLRDLELELYQLFDGVLLINEQESRMVEPGHSGRIHFVPPMMPWEIKSTGEPGRDPVTAADEPFDLIFVGSEAPPNVRGLTWFYRQVFVPYLRRHRVRLAVIGKVCGSLDFDDWYMTKLGAVPGDLEGYYARSKVVVVPIHEGSGLSIKTVEGLSRGRAVATSPVGARGLRHDPDAFLRVDMVADPRGTAEAILDLLSSEPERRRMERTALDYYRTHFGRERYFNAMDQVMASLDIAT